MLDAFRSGKTKHSHDPWGQLDQRIVACDRCPRLRDYCQRVAQEKRRAYIEQEYWGRPVPNFVGSPPETVDAPAQRESARRESARRDSARRDSARRDSARRDLVIVGLAPGAHGANRTGRLFTGDRSGEWLYRALHHVGIANQPLAIDRHDGTQLHNAIITNVCHCAPPDNKPTPDEIQNCQPFLQETLGLARPIVVLALGKIAWDATLKLQRQQPELFLSVNTLENSRDKPADQAPNGPQSGSLRNPPQPPAKADGDAATTEPRRTAQPKFGHGHEMPLGDVTLLGCYHPSQQNTFTGRLTAAMLDAVMSRAVELIAARRPAAFP
jgi:uracil-DNA glycosylase family 4